MTKMILLKRNKRKNKDKNTKKSNTKTNKEKINEIKSDENMKEKTAIKRKISKWILIWKIYNKNKDISETPTQPPIEPHIIIENRVRLIKTFEINKECSKLKNNFEQKQLINYINDFQNELSIGLYKECFDFITFFKYKDFNITIYPLDTEKYAKDNLLDVNNLCFINFTIFSKFMKSMMNHISKY